MTDPFFLETLLASNLLPFETPAVIAHEWGHLAGLARESDASFFGLLVCLHGDAGARYSAWLEIFVGRWARGRGRSAGAVCAGCRRPPAPTCGRWRLGPRATRCSAVRLLAWRRTTRTSKAKRVESGVRNYGEVVQLLAGTRFEAGWTPVLRPDAIGARRFSRRACASRGAGRRAAR